VPAEIVDSVQSKDQSALGGQARDIVAMFFDIRDFTKITASLPPQVALSLVNRVFTVVSSVVQETRGWIDKFLGDGVLVTWGALGNSRPDPEAAMKAAWTILQRVEELNDGFKNEGLPAVRVGMGIHCGSAIVGNIGSENRMEFTSMGATVNVASRLQELCKGLSACVVVSEALLRRLPAETVRSLVPVDNLKIRGVGETMRVGILADNSKPSVTGSVEPSLEAA
jgi:adenylate cyclase